MKKQLLPLSKYGKPRGRRYEDFTHEEIMEIFMTILDRLSAAITAVDTLKAENADLTTQVANLQTQLATATTGTVAVSAVEPLLTDILGPDTSTAAPADTSATGPTGAP